MDTRRPGGASAPRRRPRGPGRPPRRRAAPAEGMEESLPMREGRIWSLHQLRFGVYVTGDRWDDIKLDADSACAPSGRGKTEVWASGGLCLGSEPPPEGWEDPGG